MRDMCGIADIFAEYELDSLGWGSHCNVEGFGVRKLRFLKWNLKGKYLDFKRDSGMSLKSMGVGN